MVAPGSTASLGQWLGWLENLSPHEIDLGLERVRQVLERLRLGRPRHVFTIGGTNGKGSSVTMLSALLSARGELTGSYTSPHVLHYGERIRVNGVAASDETIVSAFNTIEDVRGEVPLTYFEYGTLAALSVFDRAGVDAAVLEVGLGGRLDAVNAVDPDASLITNVSLDHCDWLGNDIETIAREKAGIMRPNKPVVFGGNQLPDAIATEADRLGAELWVAGRDFSHETDAANRWRWSGRKFSLPGLEPLTLEGAHQVDNASAVLALLEAAGQTDLLEPARINRGLAAVHIAGRLEHVNAAQRNWILDGAHNPAGAQSLASTLKNRPAGGVGLGICGILDDKDAAGIIEALTPCIDRWIATTADSARAIPARELGALIAGISGQPCRIEESMEGALQAAIRQTGDGDSIVVAGSFYTVAAASRGLARIASRGVATHD